MKRICLSITILALACSASTANAAINSSDALRYTIEERDPANEYPMGCRLAPRAQEQIQPIIYDGWRATTPRTRTICNFFARVEG